MKFLKRNDSESRRLEGMGLREKTSMIKRLERERNKVNAEIEALLKSYSKESGNEALKRKRKVFAISDIFMDL